MTQEEFEREMLDLQRYTPPPSDPIALLKLETRIYDLEQENKELRSACAEIQAAHDALLRERVEWSAGSNCERAID